MKNWLSPALPLAIVLCLGLGASALATDEKVPVCTAQEGAAASLVPATEADPAVPPLFAPAPVDPSRGFTPAPLPAACPPLAAGCCRVFVPGYPCPMCGDFGCD